MPWASPICLFLKDAMASLPQSGPAVTSTSEPLPKHNRLHHLRYNSAADLPLPDVLRSVVHAHSPNPAWEVRYCVANISYWDPSSVVIVRLLLDVPTSNI